jgi:hypothetical protein
MNTKRTPDIEDLNHSQRARLIEFRDSSGPDWKQKLMSLWQTGGDERLIGGHYLRQVRNQWGPQWLLKLKD